jgi:LPXTG-motif cell wall-anchored protein
MDDNQLRDIRGLDVLELTDSTTLLLPPITDENNLILLIIGLFVLLALFLLRKKNTSWQQEAQQSLKKITKKLNKSENSKLIAEELSQLIRRIAMSRHGRDSCAGLEGKHWLQWLQQNDPKQFDWSELALPLITLPYAPDNTPVDSQIFKQIIKASYRWTEHNA